MVIVNTDWLKCLPVPHLAEHALGWALLLNACAASRVGNIVGAALLSKDVVEKTAGGATTLAIERSLGGGVGTSGRRHDVDCSRLRCDCLRGLVF